MRGRLAYTLAAISLAVAVPLIGILGISFANVYESRVRLVEQERAGYARLSGLAFRSLVQDSARAMRLLGAQGDHFLDTPSLASTRLLALATQYPASYVVMTDEFGVVRVSSDQGLVGKDFSSSEAFANALLADDGFGIEPSSKSEDGRVGPHVAQRIVDENGKVIGVMLMRIDVRRLHNEFPVEVPTGGISIIDSDGQVVFQNEDQRFAEQMQQWADRYPFVARALAGAEAPTRDFGFPLGERRIGTFVPIPELGWAAGSSVDLAVPLTPFWESTRLFVLMAVLVSMAGLIAAAVISSRIRRSLVTLAGDAHRIGGGDFDTPVVSSRTDEIGQMAASLERARQELKSYAEENARLYDAEHSVAEKLQSALLAVPARVEGVEYAVRYRSATDTARVGGDFYDIFPLDEGRVGITIGDMSGHGVDAAVLTSLVKTAIRVRASEPDPSPGEVLSTANQVLYGGSGVESFATVFFGVLDTVGTQLTYSGAGHPSAAVLSPSGVRPLISNSPIVGGFPRVGFSASSDVLAPDELLFLYTDGLIEARRDKEFYTEERLFDLLATLYGLSPEALVDRVFNEVFGFAEGRFSDDVALLAIRLDGSQAAPGA